MLKVLTTGRLADEFSKALSALHPEFNIRNVDKLSQEDIDWAECLACFPVSGEVTLKKLPWIHSFGAGVDGFMQRTDLNKNLKLTRTTGQLGYKAGEFCLCHILNFFQATFSIYEDMQKKHWSQRSPYSCKDKNILILGTGNMARGIAKTLNSLNIKSIGLNTQGYAPGTEFSQCVKIDAVDRLAKDIACIINTLPLNKKTTSLIDYNFLSAFSNVLFINIGRGKSLVVDDLLRSISEKHLAYAVLDVFEEEPLPESSSLWKHPKIFISPHQAAITDVQDVVESFVEAYRLIGTDTKSEVFISLEKGY